jgi:hypothetical protein
MGAAPTVFYQSFFFKLHRQFADYSFEALVLTFEPALLLCFLRHLKNFTGILQKLVAP